MQKFKIFLAFLYCHNKSTAFNYYFFPEDLIETRLYTTIDDSLAYKSYFWNKNTNILLDERSLQLTNLFKNNKRKSNGLIQFIQILNIFPFSPPLFTKQQNSQHVSFCD